MKYNVTNKRAIAVLIAIIFMAACANKSVDDDLSAYRTDADNLCKVHSVEHWEANEQLNSLSVIDRLNVLTKEISSSVTLPEMQDILIGGQGIDPNQYYTYLKEEIPKLTKEPFECPAIKDFPN